MKSQFEYKFHSKSKMFQLFKEGETSDDYKIGSDMYFAMLAYETHGDATRDNSFEDLVKLGKEIEEGVE